MVQWCTTCCIWYCLAALVLVVHVFPLVVLIKLVIATKAAKPQLVLLISESTHAEQFKISWFSVFSTFYLRKDNLFQKIYFVLVWVNTEKELDWSRWCCCYFSSWIQQKPEVINLNEFLWTIKLLGEVSNFSFQRSRPKNSFVVAQQLCSMVSIVAGESDGSGFENRLDTYTQCLASFLTPWWLGLIAVGSNYSWCKL